MVEKQAFDNIDVDTLLSQLTLEEKIELLSGQGSFKTTSLPAYGIPSITVSSASTRYSYGMAVRYPRISSC